MIFSGQESLLVIGAGYVGFEAALEARKKGFQVYALARSEQKKKALQDEGIVPLYGDLTAPETLPEFPSVQRVLFAAAPDAHTESDYEIIYVKGLQAVLERLTRADQILWISSTSVWGEEVQGVVDESVIPSPREAKAKLLLEAERQVLSSRFPAMILRLSGIYGPGRNRLAAFRVGRWPEPQTPLRYLNLIHREDIVRAIDFLFDRGEPGEVYIGTDCEPSLNRELARWLSVQFPRSQPVPGFSGLEPAGKRCSSFKLQAMGFSFRYPAFREGYSGLIAAYERTHEFP